MAIVSWEPTRELQSIQQEMNRLFGTFFDPEGAGNGVAARRRWIPAMDLVEEGESFVLRLDVPGVSEDDVKVELAENVLTISGERKTERESEKDGSRRIERAWGSFSRSLTLPDGIDADAIDAQYDRGVLEVRIPKPELRKPRRVSINVGNRPPVIDAEETPGS